MKNREYIDFYKKFYKKNNFNFLRYICGRISNYEFSGNILIRKMYNCKNPIRKQLYYNKLKKKYSIIVAKNSEIGKNVLFVHLIGTVIGRRCKNW